VLDGLLGLGVVDVPVEPDVLGVLLEESVDPDAVVDEVAPRLSFL
jgi:hypothetical protein